MATTLPTDPLFASQWHLNNTGQRGAPGIDVNLAPVWGRYTGKGVIVAVNDDGMDLAHPDLLANYLLDRVYDATRDTTGQGFAADAKREHGTVVGSLIGMIAGNGIGGVGIAYEAKIVPALTGGGDTNAKLFLANLASNAAVSVNSWGNDAAFGENFGASGSAEDRAWGEALVRAATEGRGGLGMVIEVSGGNERANRADNTLSNFNGNKLTISVGAVTNEGRVTSYSTPGLTLLVSAPGGNSDGIPQSRDEGYGIVSADVAGDAGYNKTAGDAGDYAYQNVGTSYSGPIVAGIAALMLEANPQLGFRDVSSILALTARKTDPTSPSWVQQSGSDWNLGGMHYSRDVGYGLVDGAAAVRLAASWAGGQNTMANWTSVAGTSATAAGAIADGSGENFVATANLAGSLVIERLELDLEITMSKPSQLAATLISPAGTSLLLFDRPLTQGLNKDSNQPEGPENAWPGRFTIGIASFLGENAQGNWTLQLRDAVTGDVAEFRSLTVRAWGHADGPQNQYIFTDEFSGSKTLTDAAGIDTVNAAAVSTAVNLSLAAQGSSSVGSGSFVLATGTVIENATGGAGNDTLAGNDEANTLRGNDGNDSLDGGAGDDNLAGGLGDDRVDGGAGDDVAVFTGPREAYTLAAAEGGVQVSGTREGNDVLLNVERLAFSDQTILASALNNNAPTAADGTAATAEDTPLTGNLPAAADADGDAPAYAVQSAPSLGVVTVNSNGGYTYTPNPNANGTDSFTFTVSDSKGGSRSYRQTVNVSAVNDAPVVATPMPDRTATVGTAFSYTVPDGTFTDVDSTTLSFSATLESGDALPAWLAFDAGTRTFSGTPPAAPIGALSVKVSASDGTAATSDVIRLNVIAAPNPALPADPLVGSQWYLSNTGQRGAAGIDLNIAPIWGRYSGAGVIVAINDDGMDLEHPDLVANLLLDRVYDAGRDTTGQGFEGADRSHGTVVGSIVGMVAGNGIGGTGIAYGAKLVPSLTGAGSTHARLFLANLASNVAVSVNSWGNDPAFAENFGAGGSAEDRAWGEALARAAIEGRGGLGMVIEVSGGNERGNRADPGLSNFNGNKFTLSVGAVTHEGKVTDYSSAGLGLLVTAPGGVGSNENTGVDSGFGIASADVSSSAGYNKAEGEAGNYAFQNQGTSYSGPMVGAIAALMIEANPRLGFRDVADILALTARKNDPTSTSWVQQAGSTWNLGGMHYSRDYGYGLVDAAAAVRLAESWFGGSNTAANWLNVQAASATAAGPVADGSGDAFVASATIADNIVVERLELELDIGMLLPSQLSATLTSPSGTTHVLFDRPLTRALDANKVQTGDEAAWPGVFTLGIASFLGEDSQGTWTLRLMDHVAGTTATFNGLTLRAWGLPAGPQHQYVFTDEYTGTHTLTDAAGIDTLNAAAVSTAVTLSLADAAASSINGGTVTLAAGTLIENAVGGAGNDSLTGNAQGNTLRGNDGADTITGGDGFDLIAGGAGSDQLDGGEGIADIADYRGSAAVTLSLVTGTATQGADSDTLAGFEAVFGSAAADTLRGRDVAENLRSDTLRGGGGNDTIDAGGGVDMAEFGGARIGYTVTRTANGFTVVDTDAANGDDGSDTLTDVERLIFADSMLAFGTRAEEIARVAFVLWTPGILVSQALFARGYSFYDNGGYDFATMCSVALIFHNEQGMDFANKLKNNMPGTAKTADQIFEIMNRAGGGEAGRVAALIDIANDPATEAAIVTSEIRTNGIIADLVAPGFGALFGLLPG